MNSDHTGSLKEPRPWANCNSCFRPTSSCAFGGDFWLNSAGSKLPLPAVGEDGEGGRGKVPTDLTMKRLMALSLGIALEVDAHLIQKKNGRTSDATSVCVDKRKRSQTRKRRSHVENYGGGGMNAGHGKTRKQDSFFYFVIFVYFYRFVGSANTKKKRGGVFNSLKMTHFFWRFYFCHTTRGSILYV